MLKQPNFFNIKLSTLPEQALVKFYLSTTFGLSFMISSVAPTRWSTSYTYLIIEIGNRNLKSTRVITQACWELQTAWTINVWHCQNFKEQHPVQVSLKPNLAPNIQKHAQQSMLGSKHEQELRTNNCFDCESLILTEGTSITLIIRLLSGHNVSDFELGERNNFEILSVV